MKRLLTARQVAQALERLYGSIVPKLPAERRLAVVGMRTRGLTLAERIIERLRTDSRGPFAVDRGVLDITFYRDDLSRRHGAPLVRATEIDFDLDDAWVLLVDDVLQTGRSVRAALDAIHDFGRPRVVRLAVLIDRGGREVPISADFVGRRLRVPPGQRVQLRLSENDGQEGAWIVKSD